MAHASAAGPNSILHESTFLGAPLEDGEPIYSRIGRMKTGALLQAIVDFRAQPVAVGASLLLHVTGNVNNVIWALLQFAILEDDDLAVVQTAADAKWVGGRCGWR